MAVTECRPTSAVPFTVSIAMTILCSMLGRPSRYTLFPYTTLFRSVRGDQPHEPDHADCYDTDCGQDCGDCQHRSEEHTSELQSRGHLVCRLLLEKKKQWQGHWPRACSRQE